MSRPLVAGKGDNGPERGRSGQFRAPGLVIVLEIPALGGTEGDNKRRTRSVGTVIVSATTQIREAYKDVGPAENIAGGDSRSLRQVPGPKALGRRLRFRRVAGADRPGG